MPLPLFAGAVLDGVAAFFARGFAGKAIKTIAVQLLAFFGISIVAGFAANAVADQAVTWLQSYLNGITGCLGDFVAKIGIPEFFSLICGGIAFKFAASAAKLKLVKTPT